MPENPAAPDDLTGSLPPADSASDSTAAADDVASARPVNDGPPSADPAMPADAPRDVGPAASEIWPPPDVLDRYTDVPASLELSATSEDAGLSPNAYDRVYPYEAIQKKRRRAGAPTSG